MEHLRILRTLFQLILLWIDFQSIICVEFNREFTGVVYEAFVHRSENGQLIPSWETYTLQNLKTMLEVISTKFTRVATYGVGAKNVKFVKNSTYKGGTQGFTAEAAARINQERMNLSITVIVGMWLSNEDAQMESEIEVAFVTAEIANNIYKGTVVGLVASHNEIGNKENLERTRQALDVITKIKDRANTVGLKVGTRQRCNKKKREVDELFKKIVNISDFIICEMQPAHDQSISGGKAGFETVGNDLLANQYVLKRVNPNIEVMGQTGWPSNGKEPWQTIDNLRIYWETANEWAVKNNFTMWLFEAFDNPWKNWDPHSAHFGWWKLKQNRDIDNLDGYAEKIYEPRGEEEPSTDDYAIPWVYIGVSLGILFIMGWFAISMFLLRVKRLQDAVTTSDLREFIEGVPDDSPQSGLVENALKVSYNKLYEIPKDRLRIKWDVILGTGQFGCVFKALIEDGRNTEVALKTAKRDCPKNALKSLLSEIKILTYLGKHPNIVCILGAYTSELSRGIVYVATELCPLGSLRDYLRNNHISNTSTTNRFANANVGMLNEAETNVDKPPITYREMVQWSHEIACGMEYLGTKHVVHGDLSTRNVLLASDKTAKITDFGLSRRLYDYTNYVKKQQEPLPWRWMAIESLKRLEFSSKSDVWSYGVTLWEIFAMGDVPYPGLSWNLDFVDSLVNGLRMKSPPHATPEVYYIMVDCWHLEPNERSTFTDLKLSTGHLFETDTGEVNNPTENAYTNGPQQSSIVYTEIEL